MLQREANGWNRTGDKGILQVLNDALNILLQNETKQTLKYEDGEFPSITTVDGRREYSAASDVWRISEVLQDYPLTSDYGEIYLTTYGSSSNYQRPVEDAYYNGKRYIIIQPVATVERIGNTAAQIIFRFNPGNNTYYYRGFTVNNQLTSERVDLPLPERLHTEVYAATIALINGYQNGNILEAIDFVKNEIKPRIDKEQNQGAQGDSRFVRVRRA